MDKIENNFMRNFWTNIIWLNLKRLYSHLIWRVILIIIHFMLFAAATLPVTGNIVWYIFIITALSNILFIYTRTRAKSDSVYLLRSIGASRVFIILDNLFEVLIEIFAAFLLFLPVLLFRKPLFNYWLLLLYSFFVVIIISPCLSLWFIHQMESRKAD